MPRLRGARGRGVTAHHPFGAMSVLDNRVIAEAANEAVTSGGPTRHAEMRALAAGLPQVAPADRVVFGCSAQALGEAAGEDVLVPSGQILALGRRALARELLAMSPEEFSAAFRKSPMKRVKLRGLKRNAAVVLGNVGTLEDVAVLAQALDEPEPLVREQAA